MTSPKAPPKPGAGAGTSVLPKINAEDEPGADSRSGSTDTNVLIANMPGMVRETLIVVTGADQGRVFHLDTEETWIGRGEDCTIVLSDKGVSRRHAVVRRKDGVVYVRDNEAKNGTLVNNRRIAEHELQPGDEIQLGPTACLVFSHADKIGMAQSARERVLAEQMQTARVESIASMVAGVAHEINGPLGVANTANAMIAALAEEVRKSPSSERLEELLADLQASTGLVNKNLARASELVRNFKLLSAREPFDERMRCDLGAILLEAIDALLATGDLKINTEFRGDKFPWVGFQSGITRVLNGLAQNAFLHAYDGKPGGVVDVRLRESRGSYRVEFEDYGAGVPTPIVPRLFEPFVTSGLEKRGTGLGLAIVHNIVTNVLGGAISFTSQRGKGTRFVISLPLAVPQD
jgi:signal transduction histidine kinase